MKRHDEAKVDKRKRAISIFIALIMILSALGVYLGNSSTSINYKEIKFNILEDNRYSTKINKNTFIFDYSPYVVETIAINSDIIQRIKNSVQVDFTSDPQSEFKESIALSQFEIAKVLSLDNIFARTGFISKNDYNLPIITCDNSTASIPVVLFMKSNETKVYNQDYCIIVSASSNPDMVALKDRIIYGYLGVIE